jgi:subtilisin family serine protease
MEQIKEKLMKFMPALNPIIRKALMVLLPLVLLFAPNEETICGELSSSLQNISLNAGESKVQVVVFFDDDPSLLPSKSLSSKELGRTKLHEQTYYNLKSISKIYNDNFERNLSKSTIKGEIIKKYWIAGAALVEVNAEDLQSLSELDGVRFIAPDTTLALIEPASISVAPQLSSGVESNLTAIKADKLWERGLTGEGRIIGSFDTGVDGSHPAVSAKWQGNINEDNSAAWFDPYGSTFPVDNGGHGTHVMGIMVGHDDNDTIGVAFNARWIGASVIDRGSGLSKTVSDILDAFEWAADPDGNPSTIDDVPDVICHSWGIPSGIFPDCDNTFWTAIDNLESLGVVCIFAAGNEGPDSLSIRQPADRTSGPLNAFAVGAIDQDDPDFMIASFSSRGPSRCDGNQIKPEVVAPGMSIRSCYPNDSYRFISGTSMAAPHVAASVALLREYNPEATSEEIKQALYSSAIDLGETGEDNFYGNGLIDLEAAIALIPPPTSPQIEVANIEVIDDNDNVVEAGEQFELMIEVTNRYVSVSGLYGFLFISDAGANIITDSSYFGSIAADQNANNTGGPFVISLNPDVLPGSNLAMDINFYDDIGTFLLTKRIELIVGQNSNATYSTIDNGIIQLTVDNFGGIGHGSRSISPAGGSGFISLNGGYDILSEFSLMIAGNNSTTVSDAAREQSIYASDNDFVASFTDESELMEPGSFGIKDLYGYYSDDLADNPYGLSIVQRTSLFNEVGLSNCVIVEYSVKPQSASINDSLYIGVLMDWDLSADEMGTEKVSFNQEGQFSYFFNQADDIYIGIRFLNQPIYSHNIISNSLDGKALLTDQDKYQHLTSGVSDSYVQKWGDYYSILSTKSVIPIGVDSIKVALAVVVGNTLEEIQFSMTKAYNKYNIVTGIDDDYGDPVLPISYTLNQNYPNPFNMATSISFNIPVPGHVRLDVYNTLGQRVVGLANGEYPAGMVNIEWDGKDKSGNDLSTGVYFYRMTFNDSQVESRKLMILK